MNHYLGKIQYSLCLIFRAYGTRAFIPTLKGGVFSPDFYKFLNLNEWGNKNFKYDLNTLSDLAWMQILLSNNYSSSAKRIG